MNRAKKMMRRFWISMLTACLLIVISPGISHQFASARSISETGYVPETVGKMLDVNIKAATDAAMPRGKDNHSMMMSYGAMMSEDNVVPNSPETYARGAVGAVLVDNRLIVRGSFRNLSSDMRDYSTDPVNPPNSDITSAFHIHRGASNENGPFQYALDVMTNETDRSGTAMGEYTLTSEQLQALSNGMLYVDLHTTMNRGGELRGILMPM